ncbi:5-(carboxyamino)imidazole ribonucleotide synthase, partial [Acinetobacter ursingii]
QQDCPAAALGQVFSSQAEHGLSAFIQSADVGSLEFENTPLEDVDALSQTKSIYPPRQALAIAQTRLLEKTLFNPLDIPVAPFNAVDSLD